LLAASDGLASSGIAEAVVCPGCLVGISDITDGGPPGLEPGRLMLAASDWPALHDMAVIILWPGSWMGHETLWMACWVLESIS
jgi:hypothetical protein